eukprot:6399718-Lingulodinium_polyedra.AAC.1
MDRLAGSGCACCSMAGCAMSGSSVAGAATGPAATAGDSPQGSATAPASAGLSGSWLRASPLSHRATAFSICSVSTTPLGLIDSLRSFTACRAIVGFTILTNSRVS